MHTLIVGRTGSGKSAQAKQLGSALRERGWEVLAYNPTMEPGYTVRDDHGCAAAEFETTNADEFMREVEHRISRDPKARFLIVDEAHEFFSKAQSQDRLWVARYGRHYGLNIIAITQRMQDVHTTLRTQCATVYIMPCSLTDAKFAADEYGSKVLAKAPDLKPGKYFKCTPDGVVKGRVF